MTTQPKQIKWLTLSVPAESAAQKSSGKLENKLPSNIQFAIKKPFFTASVVLDYRLSDSMNESSQILAQTKLEAKIPIYGSVQYSIEVKSVGLGREHTDDKVFGFESTIERDDGKGNYRKVTASGTTLTLETRDAAAEVKTKSVKLAEMPPAPLLVHLLVLPALQQSREPGTDIYVAQLVNGAKFQALRLDRLAKNETHETYRGRTISLSQPLNETEFRNLSWENAKSFEFDFDLAKNSIAAMRIQLPIVGKLEIK